MVAWICLSFQRTVLSASRRNITFSLAKISKLKNFHSSTNGLCPFRGHRDARARQLLGKGRVLPGRVASPLQGICCTNVLMTTCLHRCWKGCKNTKGLTCWIFSYEMQIFSWHPWCKRLKPAGVAISEFYNSQKKGMKSTQNKLCRFTHSPPFML